MSGRPYEILVGDVRRVLRDLPSESFDACFSDPPYGIRFMGQRWDYSVPTVNVFTELLRVLRPGAAAKFFGGTQTFHRMMVNIEDAGFIPIDLCMWVYGSAMPHGVDVSKQLDKAAGHWRGRAGKVKSGNHAMSGPNYERSPKGEPVTTAGRRWSGYWTRLKPAWEPCGLFVKWSPGTIAETVLVHGVGALNIDGCRIGSVERFNAPAGNTGKTAASVGPKNVTGYQGKTVVGRYPANFALSHSPDCEEGACVEDCPARMLDEQGGNRPGMKGGGKHRAGYRGGMFGKVDSTSTARGDEGGASRFFYSAKVQRAERDRGLEDFPVVPKGVGALRDNGRGSVGKNDHPTLKPIDLCRYYAKLLLPPPRADGAPRRIIVPYSGAGSEMIGCLQAGWDEVVGIELNPKHAEKALARISRGKIIQNAK